MKRMGAPAAAVLCLLAFVDMAEADVRLMRANGMKSVMQELAPVFERQTGQRPAMSFATLGVVVQRIEAGESADLALIPAQGTERLVRNGRSEAATVTAIARSGIGVIIRKGTSKPDVSTADALKATLLSARSLTYLDPAMVGPAESILPRCSTAWASPRPSSRRSCCTGMRITRAFWSPGGRPRSGSISSRS